MCICIIGVTMYIFVAAVPGVLSVQPDENFGSDDKDYAGFSSLVPFVTFFVGFRFFVSFTIIVFLLGMENFEYRYLIFFVHA